MDPHTETGCVREGVKRRRVRPHALAMGTSSSPVTLRAMPRCLLKGPVATRGRENCRRPSFWWSELGADVVLTGRNVLKTHLFWDMRAMSGRASIHNGSLISSNTALGHWHVQLNLAACLLCGNVGPMLASFQA